MPEIKTLPTLMHDLVTSNFDDDSIKNDQASMVASPWDILDTQGQLTPQQVIRSGQNSNLSKTLCMSFVSCKFKNDQISSNREKM